MSHKGLHRKRWATSSGEAIDPCGRQDRLRGLDAVGNRGGFLGLQTQPGDQSVARREGFDPDG